MSPVHRSIAYTGSGRTAAEVIDSLRVGVLIADPDGHLAEINPTAARLLGIDAGESRGKHLLGILATGSVVYEVAEKTLPDMRAFPGLVGPLLSRNGECTVRCGSSILRDLDGDVVGILFEIQDVTSITHLEKMVQQLDRLATVGRFASTIAHEIRNPLTGIYAGIQFLEKSLPPENEQQRSTYFILREEVERLNRIVTDMLESARPPDPRLVLLDPGLIVYKVKTLLQEDADRKGVKLTIRCDETLPEILLDPDLISQVLLNLGRNAIEVSPDGGEVTISTDVSTSAPSLGILPRAGMKPGMEFRVCDQGPGVPESEKSRIFEPFHTSKKGGTGLGLFISYQIMERHGGNLWIESEEGRGAEFIARIPYETGGVEE